MSLCCSLCLFVSWHTCLGNKGQRRMGFLIVAHPAMGSKELTQLFFGYIFQSRDSVLSLRSDWFQFQPMNEFLSAPSYTLFTVVLIYPQRTKSLPPPSIDDKHREVRQLLLHSTRLTDLYCCQGSTSGSRQTLICTAV